jgi:hypothetical protein
MLGHQGQERERKAAKMPAKKFVLRRAVVAGTQKSEDVPERERKAAKMPAKKLVIRRASVAGV